MQDAAGDVFAPGQHQPRPHSCPLTCHRAISTGLPSGGCLQHSADATNKSIFTYHFLKPLNRSPVWFESDEHHHVSPSGFHAASTHLTPAVAGSINPRGCSEAEHRHRRGAQRCREWVISACWRHYDAVPYLTTLLLWKSSAAVWPE